MIFENIIMSFRAILSNKLRSGLTILGIVIGIGSVISMLSVGEGAKQYISSGIEQMGSNLLTVRPGSASRGLVRTATDRESLILADSEALKEHLKGKAIVAPEASTRGQVKYQNKNTNTTLVGITPEYFTARNYTLEFGMGFTDEHNARSEKIAILGWTVANALFENGEMPVGKTIRINREPFKVVGVYQQKGNSGGWQDADDQIFIPLQTVQNRLLGTDALRAVYVSVAERGDMTLVEEELKSVLRRRHRIKSPLEDDFNIRSQVELMDTMDNIGQAFTLLLGSIAFISLLVGGIGIMNILLVSVTERTKEVGIRKAIGAYESDILVQFLLESVTLCLIGGISGILLGVAVSHIIGIFGPWEPVITAFSVILSLVVSFSVGIFFGFYPARKAARMDPVEALRFE